MNTPFAPILIIINNIWKKKIMFVYQYVCIYIECLEYVLRFNTCVPKVIIYNKPMTYNVT